MSLRGVYILFIELLVQALFRPDITVNPEHKEKYVYLLAYATSVYEIMKDFQNVPVKEELAITQEAIVTAHGICSSANDSHTELLTNMAALFDTLRFIIVLVCECVIKCQWNLHICTCSLR